MTSAFVDDQGFLSVGCTLVAPFLPEPARMCYWRVATAMHEQRVTGLPLRPRPLVCPTSLYLKPTPRPKVFCG